MFAVRLVADFFRSLVVIDVAKVTLPKKNDGALVVRRYIGQFLSCGSLALLAACAQTPLAPTVAVMPGPNKSYAAFQTDQEACERAATTATAPLLAAANKSAVAGVLAGVAADAAVGNSAGGATANGISNAAAGSANGQATVQQQYDITYSQCMYAAGDLVPGMEPQQPAEEAPPPPPTQIERDPLTMKVQQQLVRLGYLHGGADGVAGPRTSAAISRFEMDKNMTVDGAISRNLLAALKSTPSPEATGTAPAAAPGGFSLPPPSQ